MIPLDRNLNFSEEDFPAAESSILYRSIVSGSTMRRKYLGIVQGIFFRRPVRKGKCDVGERTPEVTFDRPSEVAGSPLYNIAVGATSPCSKHHRRVSETACNLQNTIDPRFQQVSGLGLANLWRIRCRASEKNA